MANFPTSPSVNDEFETNKVTYIWNGEAWEIAGSGSGGAGGGGNVVGPSSAVDDMLVTFDGTTGKILQDSGVLLSGLATSAHTHGINNLTDVDTSTAAPTDGQTLVWDNTNSIWEPGTISGGGGSINGLSDVDTSTTGPTDGQALVWDNANSTWEPGTVSGGGGGGGDIDGLSDVDTSTNTPTSGQALLWDASSSQWEPASISGGNSGFDPDAAVTFNDSGNAVDFRIESNGNENAFFVDGSNSQPRVGIGTNSPGHVLHLKTTGVGMCGIALETPDSTSGGVLAIHHSNDSAGPNNNGDLSFVLMNVEDSDLNFTTNALPFFSGSSSGVGGTMSLNRNGNIGMGQAVADYIVGGTSTDLLPKETLDVDGAVTFREMTAPSATANHAKLYSKDVSGTSKMFTMDSTGTEAELGGSGGGGSFDPDGAVTFNDSGADVDFRIESDTNENAFFLNGESGHVGIGADPGTTGNFGLMITNPADGNAGIAMTNSTSTNGGMRMWQQKSVDGNSFIMAEREDSVIIIMNDVATMMGGGGTWGGVGLEFGTNGNLNVGLPSAFSSVAATERLTVNGGIALEKMTAPTATANFAKIYAKEVSGSAEMFVLDEGGNETQISPHNPDGEWEYFSRNLSTGKVVRINMERMIRDIEELTGKTYIEEE